MSRPARPRLALGTAQFGLDYGPGGAPRRLERVIAREVLAAAWELGIDLLDTAAAYGEAEKLIGELRSPAARFAVVSKTPRLGLAMIGAADIRRVEDRVRQSLAFLGVSALEALLVHHAPDLLSPGGAALFRALEGLRASGFAGRIGVSVYDAPTLDSVLGAYPIQIVQLPINVLDQRFVVDGTLVKLAQRGVEVHARSVFLQGLLLTEAAQLPTRFAGIRAQVGRFQSDAIRAGLSASAAALQFVAGCPGVTRVVVGVDSAAQLRANAAHFAAALSASAPLDFGAYAVADAALVDPRSWS